MRGKKRRRALTMQKRQFEKFGLNFVVKKADRVYVEKVTLKLGLGQSEVCRRALRLGLRELENLDLPGTKTEVVIQDT
jgi:hypothetical protein